MGLMEEEKGVGKDFTQDGTTDLKGKPVLRSNTGRWRACYFMLGYEVCERMAYYGISTNLVLYLTRELHEGTVKSSNNVTNWVGTVWMTPLLGAYIADTYLGRYWTFMIASVIYLLGMCLLTLVVSLSSLKPPSCGKHVSYLDCDKRASSFQVGIFYCALYIIAIGTGGTKPNISTMGADQFDDFEPKERAQKLTFFNWWMFSIFFGTLFSNTFLVYIQDTVGWGLGYGIPTLALLVAIIAFKQGTTLIRSMGPHFEIPPASLSVFLTISMLISIAVYDRLFVPLVRKYTKNPRGITLLQRMAIGLILHIVTMIIASFVERRRLNVARDHGIVGEKQIVPLRIFILLPQFVLMGIADCFLEVAKLEFFYDQAPEGMKSLGTAYFTTSLGVGFFLSSFILSTVADVTKKNGYGGWIRNNLNKSRLDYYYAFFVVLSFANFLFFLVVAKNFDYNSEVDEPEQELKEGIGKFTEQGYVAG
ncbi:protein NRT1/ PTR FAMILY 5.2-like [Cynara cardunculus var. scolymus]|uniref:protein NRT1/ PTR FAMILY 5.2-like n=1 Tax=Cynara cardunculus var. scolymus TaxID=59895 RepID=UPI000D62DBE5|nr:protein NRT1/ PTR FAMILY 5.2-like [Cynara cardunculus var. scolymus]